jgi:small-conductance mechanosensitive channel
MAGAAKWFVDTLEKMDSKAETVMSELQKDHGDVLDHSNGHGDALPDNAVDAQATEDNATQHQGNTMQPRCNEKDTAKQQKDTAKQRKETAKQDRVEEMAAKLKAKDAIISQMQEEHAQFKAAKAAEEKRFHELRQGLERDKESLKHSLEEERSRFHAEATKIGGMQEFHAQTQRELERAKEETESAINYSKMKEESLHTLQQEFAEYKLRATRLLQVVVRVFVLQGGGLVVHGLFVSSCRTLPCTACGSTRGLVLS